MTDEVAPESHEALALANVASAMIVERQDMTPADRATMRKLGVTYGRGSAWPLFRSVKQGYLPWYLDSYEAVFLTSALKNVLDVASRVAVGELGLYAGREPGELLTRVQEHGLWQDRWVTFPLPPRARACPCLSRHGETAGARPLKTTEPVGLGVGFLLRALAGPGERGGAALLPDRGYGRRQFLYLDIGAACARCGPNGRRVSGRAGQDAGGGGVSAVCAARRFRAHCPLG